MSAAIVQTDLNVCLVGGAVVCPQVIKETLAYAPVLVAADSGAAQCLAAGYAPKAVIGDMDSLAPDAAAKLPPDSIFRISEQDSTDFDKALRNISCPVLIGVGFSGGRIDHELAAFHTLVQRADRRAILVREEEVVFLCPPSIVLPTEAGDTVSLFPMLRVSGASDGLEWPIDGLDLAPGSRVGTSNRALGRVRLTCDRPGMLVILPRRHLGQMVQQLAAVPSRERWPARA